MTWESLPLRDIGQWFGGGTPSKANPAYWLDGSVPWLSPKDMGADTLSGTKDHITEAAVSGSAVKIVPAGAVSVVVRSGILERKLPVALVPFATTLNQDMKAVVPRDGIDSRWVAWGLRAFERDLLRGARKAGTTVASIEMSRFHSFRLPVPPLPEQRRIVDILEDHLSRLDAASGSIATARRRSRAWRQGLLDGLVWQPGTPTRRVGALLREPMRNGRSDRAVRDGQPGIRTLTLTAVTKNAFTPENTKITTTTESVARGLWLEPGDVLVQRANTAELVGTTARYDGPREWAIFPDLLIRLRSDEDVIDSRFMAAALRTERAHRFLRGRAKGLAGSMPKIDQEAVAETEIPLPSMYEQREVLHRLDRVESSFAGLLAELAATERRASALRRALLAAAFAGKLTGRHTDQEVIEEIADV